MCINAKAETVDTSPTFRTAFEKRRCVVPADGFYEWRGPKAAREPLYGFIQGTAPFFSLPGSSKPGRPSLVNGRRRSRSSRRRPIGTLEPIHNRMPVILDEAGAADWMNWREPDPLSLKRLLVPAPEDLLVVRPASPLVNNVKNEGPELLEDLSLFGQYGSERF
jgi:putative SOS response-associated peptidase YedK